MKNLVQKSTTGNHSNIPSGERAGWDSDFRPRRSASIAGAARRGAPRGAVPRGAIPRGAGRAADARRSPHARSEPGLPGRTVFLLLAKKIEGTFKFEIRGETLSK